MSRVDAFAGGATSGECYTRRRCFIAPSDLLHRPLDIYCIAIGGTGMAPLACLLQEEGHQVRGSDGPLYPPMSTLLERAGIHPQVGFDAAHLEPRPDLVIVGNAVPRSNPEALEVERLGLERISMPEALARFFLAGRRPLVVAGTHGKTTTSALAAWAWQECGRDPGYLVGGAPCDLDASFRRGHGARFIVEGDEYNAAYFDRGAKFLHYRPETLILTSVEYDHADLYPSPAALLDAYRRLIAQLPESGLLVGCGDSEGVLEVMRQAPCATSSYGLGEHNQVRPLRPPVFGPWGSRFTLLEDGGETEVTLPVWGEHNVSNALGVWAAARRDGIPAADLARAFGGFHGVKRRQEELGTVGQVTVVDDFAHHPTAVEKTVQAMRSRYPGRRLLVLFEPRSLTAGREMFFEAYVDAFARADLVWLAPIYHAGRLESAQRLDREGLARRLAERGVRVRIAERNDALIAEAAAAATPGDVVITMSSGSFDGAPRRVLEALAGAPRAVASGSIAQDQEDELAR
jgi:UDP-N-acetylmuramate: L-alanyl-gamma-D-glutamyl-meso-diaminopimelate ligase